MSRQSSNRWTYPADTLDFGRGHDGERLRSVRRHRRRHRRCREDPVIVTAVVHGCFVNGGVDAGDVVGSVSEG